MIMMITRCRISNNHHHLLQYTYHVRLISLVKELETRTRSQGNTKNIFNLVSVSLPFNEINTDTGLISKTVAIVLLVAGKINK